jgi:hypothetical protein
MEDSQIYSGLSMGRIDGVRLKIERAKKHISDLDVSIRAFCDSEPYSLGIKEHPEIAQVALHVRNIEPIPDEIALVIGDAVHNLRSALDHLSWQLVEAGGGTPSRSTYFPICQTAQQYTSAIVQGEINKMRPGAEIVTRAVQPYETGDDTLWHIHELDRIDKHRLILTVTTVLRDWQLAIQPGWDVKFDVTPGDPLIDGYEIVRIPATTSHPQAHKGFKLGLDVAFGESEIVAGKPVFETLNGMADFVGSLITNFEPFLL